MGTLGPQARCAACGADVSAGYRFCPHCGKPVGSTASDDAERRQLTVLFCDLADSTALAQRLDPEDLRDIVLQYQAVVDPVIERFGGRVAQWLGDGVLAYFGYPEAHGDDARRAVRAALATINSIDDFNHKLEAQRGIRIAVRVAAHTGLVVAGDVGAGRRREQAAVGSPPNIAARLQEIAAPGTVVISDATYRIVGGFFECESLGAKALKGRPEPMLVYRVLEETGAETLFDVAVARGLSAPVGRRAELEHLDNTLSQATSGAGKVVIIQGDAGIGKSRLVQLFRERQAAAANWALCRCSPDGQNSALRPILHLIERLFRFDNTDTPRDKLTKMIECLKLFPALPQDAIPLLAALLAVPTEDKYPPMHLSPLLQRRKTQEALLALLLGNSGDQPIVLTIEDLHWADPSTLELLSLAVRRAAGARVVLLCTTRPGLAPFWGAEPSVSVLHLERLGPPDVETLATSIAGGRALPRPVLDQLVMKADGVPLFVEELTRWILDSGYLVERGGQYVLRDSTSQLEIPGTLHDSLLSRLDPLGPAKAVVQLASVIGRELTFQMIQAISPLDEASLKRFLAQLVDAGLLYKLGEQESARFQFKHALIQDAAYQSLLKSTRRRYHQSIADVFSQRFPEMRKTQPEWFGHHYAEAGLPGPAIECWTAAGHLAARTGSAVESITHYRRALTLLEGEPAGLERDRQELGIQMRLGETFAVAQGYASPEAAHAYHRAEIMVRGAGAEPKQLFDILGGLYRFHYLRADLNAALDHATQLLERSAHLGPLERVVARYSLGFAQWSRGEFMQVLPYLDEGLALDLEAWGPPSRSQWPEGTGNLAQGVQARCSIRTVAAMVRSHLGELDAALEMATESLTMASQARQYYSEAFALYSRALVHFYRHDPVRAAADATRVIEISREHGYFFVTLGAVLNGWGRAASEDSGTPDRYRQRLDEMRNGIDGYRRPGAQVTQTIYLAILADAHRALKDATESRRVLDEAEEKVRTTGERSWQPELHRLRGALATDAGDHETAEREIRNALRVAHLQTNRLLEIRAALDLARLLRDRNEVAQAREIMQRVVGGFPEGLTTPDLQEARALLQPSAVA